jgi:c-di-GMP-binding flagellar brake protein YcgR
MDQKRSSERIEFLNDESVTLFDLSSGGACCRHAKMVAIGALLKVRVNDLNLNAKVVYTQERSDGARLGVQFLNVPAEKQKVLDELVGKFSRGVPITCVVEDDTPTKKV